MHRSASTNRLSEEFFVHASSLSTTSPGLRTIDNDELPVYNPVSDVAKKEKSRLRSAENVIHVIPLVLVLCAIILWFFSNPEVDMVNKGGSIVGRNEGLTIDGDLEVNGSETGLLSSLELEDLDPPKQMADHKTGRFLGNKSK